MGLFTSIALYIMIWWLVLFAVLPIKARPEAEHQEGNAASAPAKPLLKLKFLITSVVAVIIWFIVFMLVTNGYFDFYAEADAMMQVDQSAEG